MALARRVGYRHGEGEALNRLGSVLRESNLARVLELFQQSLRIAQTTRDRALEAQNLRSIGIIYVYLRDQRQGLAYYFQALKIGEQLRDESRVVIELSNIGLAYDLFGQLDSIRLGCFRSGLRPGPPPAHAHQLHSVRLRQRGPPAGRGSLGPYLPTTAPAL